MSQFPVAIAAADLRLVLAAAKLRRYTRGRTCQLCVLSAAPVLTTHCRDRTRDLVRRDAPRYGISPAHVQPLSRGGIATLYERTNTERGRQEVLRTWGAGIRALRLEPRHVLAGGAA